MDLCWYPWIQVYFAWNIGGKMLKNQLSHILNVANKVAFTTIELHIRKPPNDKI